MISTLRRVSVVLGLCGVIAAGSIASGPALSEEASPKTQSSSGQNPETPEPGQVRKPTVTEARERAVILHDLLHQMLLTVHDNYFREDESFPLPAAVFRQVFDKLAAERSIEIRWLGVEVEPMNIDHRPKDKFERAAVAALKSGQLAFEEISDGKFRYAGPIRLSSVCLKCHVPNRTSTRDRLAGIVIGMPVAEDRP